MESNVIRSPLIFKDAKIKDLVLGNVYDISDVLSVVRLSSFMKIRHVVLEGEHIYDLDEEKLGVLNESALSGKISGNIRILEVLDTYGNCRERCEEFCKSIVSEIKGGISEMYKETGDDIVGVSGEQLLTMYLSDDFTTPEGDIYFSFAQGLGYWFAMKKIRVSSSGNIIYFQRNTGILHFTAPTKERDRYKEFSRKYINEVKDSFSDKNDLVGIDAEQLLAKFIDYDMFARCLNSWFELRGISVSSASGNNILFKRL